MARQPDTEPEQDTRPEPPKHDGASTGARTAAEWEDQCLRARAELENLRKRYARQLPGDLAQERDRVAAAWLPVVDNLERALSHADDGADPVIDGVRAVHGQAIDLLSRLGYRRHDEIGVPFDPRRHEAVEVHSRDDVDPSTVLRVVRAGYGDDAHRLRPAAVVVSSRGQE